MADSYMVMNGPAPTTAAQVAVTTGTAIKTMLQITTPATRSARVIQWWIEFDASAAAAPVKVELIKTGAVAATVTAFVAGDITKWADPNAPNSLMTLGTANSGYTASAEGTITATDVIEAHWVPPTGGIYVQYPLGREPEMLVSEVLRIRVTSGVAYNCLCGITWEE